MNDPSQFDAFKNRIEANPRLTQEAKRETRYYYLEQSEMMTKFLMGALLLGLAGGFAGLFFAAFMQSVTVSTVNF